MYSPFRHISDIFWKRRPIHLTFFVTRRCNSRCPYCFYLRSGNGPEGAGTELSLDEIEKVSASLGRLLWLAFSGGEIFLREDLAEIAKIFYRNNKPAIMLFPTNGLLPDLIHERMEEILRSCPRSVVALKLSLDGLGDAHDSLRGVPGSFTKTLQTCRTAATLAGKHPNLELGVNTVFCSDNQDAVEGIIEFVRCLENVKTHTISLVRGDLSDKRYGDVDLDKYLAAVRKLERNLKEGKSPVYRFRGGRIKAAQDIVQRRLIDRTAREDRRIIPCYAGRLNLVLTELGEVFPCELLRGSLGNARDYGCDIRKVCGSDQARGVLASIADGRCHCTHECYFMTNILFNPRIYPSLLKEYLLLRPKKSSS